MKRVRASYPPNVTGNEPEIVGGAEGKCSECYLWAEDGVQVPDGVIEVCGELVCLDCLKDYIYGNGIDWDELVKLIKEEEA